MNALSWALHSKEDWQRKAADPKIRAKWYEEAVSQIDEDDEDELMTEGMRACSEAIWYSDRLIQDDVLQRLKSAAKALEDVPDSEKDWHPGSDDQVLDLIHPSLYCLVYGRTHAYLPNEPRTAANLLPVHRPPTTRFESLTSSEHAMYDKRFNERLLAQLDDFVSEDFCWMPSDFAVDSDGVVALASPYINNLHPVKHQSLYRAIEEILTAFIPMFERVLGDANLDMSGRNAPYGPIGSRGYVNCIWDNLREEPEDPRSFPKTLPEAMEYEGQLEEGFKPVPLRGMTIQCIIKLANIHLTPENPQYDGGSWHIEGMANEGIVASGIYYYDEENLTQSKLAFRSPVGDPHYHFQNDHECQVMLYDIDNNTNCVQDLGAVITKAGRALSWPNLYQHRVSPIELADPSKPGHRKILAIFLVDPTKALIPSASDVPPQQAEWAVDAFEEAWASAGPRSVLSALPLELRDMIKEEILASGTVMTLKEAEDYRLELMEERTSSIKYHNEVVSERTFNMCEH
ncbi:hypothetical protein B0H16DRAFT_1677470 [Mycena metata]|uniref:DUF4246 domain-containing protein n=1 Tax=Mycena metata TaxID=1033252 RepID=A0AAD7HPH1_9AGAR|nr:hypothetical protein B0H16DRAFT_1677470 [Mycena metata]